MEHNQRSQWPEVAARDVGTGVAYRNDEGLLCCMKTDGTRLSTHGPLGGLNTPIAVSRSRGVLYTSKSLDLEAGSSIVAIDMGTGAEETLVRSCPGLQHVWLLALSPAEDRLLSVAIQDSDAGHVAGHHLSTIITDTGECTTALLPEQAFLPLAIAFDERLVMFGRGEEVVLVDFSGDIKAAAAAPDGADVLCGDYDPGQRRFLFSSESTYSLGPGGDVVCVAPQVPCARRVPSSPHLAFCRQENDLWLHDLVTHEEQLIVSASSLGPSRGWGRGYRRPPEVSPAGQWMVGCLSWTRASTAGERADAEAFIADMEARNETSYFADPDHTYEHCFCVVDLEHRERWSVPGYAHSLAWL